MSSLSLVTTMTNRDEHIANKNVARDVLNDILKETIDVVNCMENFRELKRLNRSIGDLTLNIYFIQSLPGEIVRESQWLREYKLYGDVNIWEFNEIMTLADVFVNDLLEESLKMTAYIETSGIKTLQQKLEHVKEVSDAELTEKVKYHIAFQTFPTNAINVLSGYEAFAESFIDSILWDAADIVLFKESPESFEEVVELEKSQSIAEDLDVNSMMKFPLIRDFNLQVGQTLIDQIVSKWCFDKEWKYFIQYADYSHDSCYEFHKYEVIFSIPTSSYPIPQATASVFFIITINKLLHENYPIEVSYNMEGSSYSHPPDVTSFNQDWLYAILCNKIKFFKRICSMGAI